MGVSPSYSMREPALFNVIWFEELQSAQLITGILALPAFASECISLNVLYSVSGEHKILKLLNLRFKVSTKTHLILDIKMKIP